MVKIKMDIFVKKYQPERYDLWRLGLEDTINQSQSLYKRSCSFSTDVLSPIS